MSTLTIKTENSSKILPGDESGLPLELWQIILSSLSAWDLCQVCCVCKTWNSFMRCVDSTRWKELYLSSTEWKHPKWPLNIESEPSSWKLAYKEQYLSSKFWQNGIKNMPIVSCLSVLKRNRVKKLINVGPGQEHENLRSALLVANDYDRICVHPGIYDEQFEMSSKIPFELVGCGELGSVILVVCIEQIAPTGRLSNLVLRAPWFTSFILKVRSGFMQIDNCILEDGMIYAQNPGTCHVRFSSFRHAAVILQHMNATVIEHCEFSQSDTADIIVEGHVKDDKNWTYSYLCQHTRNLILPHAQSDVLEEKSSDLETSTNENTQRTNLTNENEEEESHVITVVEVPDTVKRNSVSVVTERMSSVSEWVNNAPSNPVGSTASLTTASVAEVWSISETSHGSLYDLDGLDSNSVTDPESRQSHHSSFSSDDDSPSMIQSDSEDDLSDGSVIMLPHLRQHHLRLAQSKKSHKQSNLSVDSSYFKPIRFDLTKDSTAKDMLNQVKGCLIHACRMSHSKGGVMVSLQGQAIISECDISNVSYGIRCIQNAQVIILKNKIHHCRTSGIFMRLASSGLVAGNDIHSNLEAGIDIRKNADPIIQHNRIHNGKRSGIVVLGSGRGQIEKNDIYENKEAGVYVLYGGNPTISGNYIYDGHGLMYIIYMMVMI
ncbi:F-box only protein 10 [Patella vulgata]|uniref:F-box only protein 10 n=1 Tax=Patella vulgata TaxID=6465 RepID=UPI0024A9FC39|nr:F-box only protein 10 [Patella vulgata]